nr:C69 family dipeptidase [Lachnospiraceae bacterium]
MSCTTLLVGKNASNDRSTMIARTDDGHFDVKKLVVVEPKDQPKKYKSVISHVEIPLPENPMRYTACPSVDKKEGIWAATGINEAGVGMTATETITTNARVLAADPMVVYKKAEKRGEKDVPGGIGEEDIVVLVLPYIRSAREGVLRLAALLEEYGTYESNGIAFNDENEIWWLETIGGHHWMAKRVPDDAAVVMPNQFGMDSFDLEDALGAGKDHLCSKDLKEFIEENRLDANQGGVFNPRNIFGSHYDSDHVYNTPRAWFMGRFLAPRTYRWDGEGADFTPESDDIPWSFVPERKLAVEDVSYLLSTHYQGTPYDPYSAQDTGKRGIYRSIGINRTGVTAICQIREGVPAAVRGVEWVCFGSTTFGAFLPVYTNVPAMPAYLSKVTLDTSTDNFYWASRLLEALADPHFGSTVQLIERYHRALAAKSRRILVEYDRKIAETGDLALAQEANDKLAALAKKETTDALNKVLQVASEKMKNGYNRADN